MSWAPEDAREVGYVLKSAGLGANGKVWDHGLYEDGVALPRETVDQVELAESRRRGLRVGTTARP